jgi:hypothetical protein
MEKSWFGMGWDAKGLIIPINTMCKPDADNTPKRLSQLGGAMFWKFGDPDYIS